MSMSLSMLLRCLDTILLLFTVGFMLSAQQQAQFTQFSLNKYAMNPAYGGMESSLSITGGIRSQWSQLASSPKTQFVNAHLPLYMLQGSAGISVINDQIGALEQTALSLSYNYVREIPGNLLFSIGAKAGLRQLRLDGSVLKTPDGIYLDNNIDHRDPILGSGLNSDMAILWGLGAAIISTQFELALSIDRFPPSDQKLLNAFTPTSQLQLFGCYHYQLDESFRISPTVLIRSDGKQMQSEIGAMSSYNDFLGGLFLRGIGSNSIDAFNIIGGIRLGDNLRLSYSFDIGLSGLRSFHEGSHEFVINYNLNKKIRTGELPKIIYNPRFN